MQPFSSAISRTRSTRSRLRWKFSPWNRGLALRKSSVLEVVGRGDLAGQEATAERAVRDPADAQLPYGRQDAVVLGLAGPQRVLGLQRRDRVDGVRPADSAGRGLGEPEVAHLAGSHQLGHRADGVLDRRGLVDPVLVVEVDVVDAEALQRRVAGLPHVLRSAGDAEELAVLAAHVAELRREHDLVAPARDGPTDEALVGEGAVHVRGVKESNAEVEGALDDGDRLGVVGRAVELAHAHAAESLLGDLERCWAGAESSGHDDAFR